MIVYLIGDSIRMNSEAHVRAQLPTVKLISPAENCEHSRKVREHIAAWAPAGPDDIIHLNCGLHDIRHDAGLSRPVCSIDEYVENLNVTFESLARIRARVIWATSTPFLEHRHNGVKESRRYRRDLDQYNEASTQTALAFGFTVNDLYAHVSLQKLEDLLLPDGLHFNDSGNAVVGSAVASAVLAQIPPNNSSKPTPLRGAA